ncbi:polysaccharide pyruvyl transferase family protein [Mammaliicoccus sciuri]|uniref:polysaccharide pyruvyl transferase family protein n=1 Tax=Mammaliicoccus sciuri TaxID=1296 RepID=UPI00194DCCF6|nr:polysaccharide pyruvyl transferase family protein [Mammaliicoccus sciuri]
MKNTEVVIAPANTDLNRGDQALVWETARIIIDSKDSTNISLISYGNSENEKYMQNRQSKKKGYNFIDPLIPHPSRVLNGKLKNNSLKAIIWGIVSLRDIIPRLMILSKSNIISKIGKGLLTSNEKELINEYLKFDMIVYKGGGFIHSYGKISDIYVFMYQLYYAIFAKRNNKKVIFLPNSFGPFQNSIAKKLYINIMNKADLITVREKISEEQNNNILNNQSFLYPDLGFFIKKNKSFDFYKYLTKNNIEIDNSKKNIGITVRPYNFSGHKNKEMLYKKYIKSISKFIEKYQENYNIFLIAQTMGPSDHENDGLAIKDVQNNLRNKVSIISDIDLNANDLVSIYGHMDFVIGTRFHSVIFAFTQCVPCIAISYGGNKGEGIMKDFSLGKYEVKIDEINESHLIQLFNELINDSDIKGIISEKLEEYNIQRNELTIKINEVLQN